MKKDIIKLHEGIINDIKPETFVDLNDGKGGFVYNFEVEEIEEKVPAEQTEEDEEPQTTNATKYRYSSLVMEAPKTQNNILETLLSERIPINREQKLLNDYNAAKEKILPASAKEAYIEFLAEKKRIKEMVEDDCKAFGIPNTI